MSCAPGGGQVGQCLTAAAHRPLPACCPCEAATLEPEQVQQRSMRRLYPVESSRILRGCTTCQRRSLCVDALPPVMRTDLKSATGKSSRQGDLESRSATKHFASETNATQAALATGCTVRLILSPCKVPLERAIHNSATCASAACAHPAYGARAGSVPQHSVLDHLVLEHEVCSLEKECAIDAIRVEKGRRIAHQLLDADLLHVAVTAVNLEAPSRDLPRRL